MQANRRAYWASHPLVGEIVHILQRHACRNCNGQSSKPRIIREVALLHVGQQMASATTGGRCYDAAHERRGMQERLERVETKVDRVDTKVGGLEIRFDRLETRFDRLETRVDHLETRFGDLDTKVDGLATSLVAVESLLSAKIDLQMENMR